MPTSTRRLWFVLLGLTWSQCQGRASYENDYMGDGQVDEYEYSDYEEEEPQPALNPQFTTEAQDIKIEIGHTIRLPCLVDRLDMVHNGQQSKGGLAPNQGLYQAFVTARGPMVISWKRLDVEGKAQYLATSTYLLNPDERFSLKSVEDRGTTLVIALAEASDVGEYVCEVSSNPPASLRHEVSIIEPPQVHILKPEAGQGDGWVKNENGEIRLHTGDELALSCHGTGDPEPRIRWTRERKRMPDGRRHVDGALIIYKNVTRKHAGTYICHGSNGPSNPAEDSVKVNVLHAPEIITEESYIQHRDGVQLELVCIVHASPKADVRWFKDGLYLEGNVTFEEINDTSSEEPDRLTIQHHGRKHILIINGIEDEDRGRYTCHAMNNIGESKGNIQVMGPMADSNTLVDHRISSARSFNEPRLLFPLFVILCPVVLSIATIGFGA
eukprot:maker-scaffold114_size351134-snap-gene-2.12 protein:Tk09554 transcript:maker-scaffold114_size351134-snap-gene-2.12-mRNA-1 annotation:"limbic system-associated membrane protein"